MIKREKKRKLRGSVLLTVVCVMSLLIVFLFGTLALATAANNRAHVNYSTAQTGVTSRTVVDAAIKAMEANDDFGNAVSKLDATSSGHPLLVNVELGAVPDAGRYGHVSDVQIAHAGKKKFYDTSKKEWVDGDVIKFTSTVSMAGVDSTTSAYIIKQPPNVPVSKPGGAGFVTTADANIECQTSLFGGSYINLPKKEIADKFNYSYTEADGSEREYSRWATDATIYRQFNSNSSFKLTNANSDFTVETDLYVNNNLELIQAPNIVFPEAGKGITVWGNIDFTQAATNRLKIIMPFDTSNLKFNEVPYIYADGCFKLQKNVINTYEMNNNETKFPLNIFCGYADVSTGSGSVSIGADIYCMNPNKDSTFYGSGGLTTLYKWTGSVVNKGLASEDSKIGGSIYSKGNVRLQSIITNGDVRVEGDCTIGSGVTINGDLVVGGKLDIDTSAVINGNVYYNPAKNDFSNVITADDIVEVDLIYHPEQAMDNLEVKENQKIDYYAYELTVDSENWQGKLDIEGNLTGKWGGTIYYKWREDVDPADIEDARNSGDVEKIKPYLNLEDGWMDEGSRPKASDDDNNTTYYYVETDAVYNEESGEYDLVKTARATGQSKFVFDKNTGLQYEPGINLTIPEFYSIPDAEGNERTPVLKSTDVNLGYFGYWSVTDKISLNKNTNEILNKDNATKVKKSDTDFRDVTADKYDDGSPEGSANKYKDNIYPDYAERNVILGLEQVNSKPTSATEDIDSDGKIKTEETKIIKRLEEILDKNSSYYVSNPYEYEGIPEEFSELHETLKKTPSLLFTSEQEIKNACVQSGDSSQICIDRSCILSNYGAEKDILITPHDKNILIVLKNFSVNNNHNIIVDDTEGGSVNFYIEAAPKNRPNTFTMTGGYLTTKRYQKVFDENKVLKYNSPSISGGYDLSGLGKPKVNIYGGKNTKMDMAHGMYVVANILSPDIEFSMDASGGILNFDSIYYNGIDIKHPVSGVTTSVKKIVFGCLNSKKATLPNNEAGVIFIPDKEGTGGSGGTGTSAFNYQIYYYDEY